VLKRVYSELKKSIELFLFSFIELSATKCPNCYLKIIMLLREINKSDIKTILDIRVSTIENHFSMEDLAYVGVTPEAISEWIDGSVKGWICEIEGQPAGFTLADSETAEVLVVACYPKFENRGVGKKLMLKVHEWLWSFGHKKIWLWSDPDPKIRAHGFYRKLGYVPTGKIKDKDEMFILRKA
jgi:GNAT superfamily N-acetyltransferase